MAFCYKDMTFCSFYKNCKKGNDCFRSLIPTVSKEAKRLVMPICEFSKVPSCHVKVKREKRKK